MQSSHPLPPWTQQKYIQVWSIFTENKMKTGRKILFFFFLCQKIRKFILFFLFLFFNFIILYWFCHISKWIRHRFTGVPHPEPSSLPVPSIWVIPVHQPQASSIVHWTWTGNSFHIWYYTCFNAIFPNDPILSLERW